MGERKGFSLVELLVVIGVFSLLLSFSIPGLVRFRSGIYLDLSARGAASKIRRTQAFSISRSENLTCPVLPEALAPGIHASTIKQFKFSSSGFPLVGGSGTQILEDKDKNIRQVVLSSAGRTRIE